MPEREVVRCECGLNQFMTRSGLCRKPDCGKPLKPTMVTVTFPIPDDREIDYMELNGVKLPVDSDLETAVTTGIGYATQFYRPEPAPLLPSEFHSQGEDLILKEILPVSRVVDQIVSNVRRKNKHPRYNREYLSLPGFPTELRLRCLQYAKEKGMSLRDVVIKAVEKLLDTD